MQVGIDIIENKRIKKILRTDPTRIFSADEIKYCTSFVDSYIHFAGLWCAKEAVIKATNSNSAPFKVSSPVPSIPFTMSEIEISHTSNGSPYVVITTKLQTFLSSNSLSKIQISLSHERNYSTAICLIV